MSEYVLDQFVSVRPGEPYRLLPFGRITRGGRARDVTPELASKFALPHFKPPIKLGSHDDPTPAGGHITALEVRGDGLYAITELNDAGAAALSAGAYRYHSPEILWEGGIEDVTTGAVIPAPLILGDALLHTPALGEAAALYTVEEVTNMADATVETVEMPKTLLERLTAWFERNTQPAPAAPEPEPEPDHGPDIERLSALEAERDEYKARLERIEAEKAQAEQLTALSKELQTGAYGAAYVEVRGAEEAASVLAGMTPEQREWVMRNFKAMTTQVNESALTGEVGQDAPPAPNTVNDRIRAYAAEHKINYFEAVQRMTVSTPDLLREQ